MPRYGFKPHNAEVWACSLPITRVAHRRSRRGQGACAPLKFGKNIFSANYYVKFGHFVNFSYIFFSGKNIVPPPKVDWAPSLLRLWCGRSSRGSMVICLTSERLKVITWPRAVCAWVCCWNELTQWHRGDIFIADADGVQMLLNGVDVVTTKRAEIKRQLRTGLMQSASYRRFLSMGLDRKVGAARSVVVRRRGRYLPFFSRRIPQYFTPCKKAHSFICLRT